MDWTAQIQVDDSNPKGWFMLTQPASLPIFQAERNKAAGRDFLLHPSSSYVYDVL